MQVAGDLLRLGDQTLADRRYGEAVAIYLRAYQAARGGGSDGEQAIALSQLALAHLANGNHGLAGLWLERAGRLAGPAQPPAWLSYLKARARWERQAGAAARAADTLATAFAFALADDAWSEAADLAFALSLHGPSGRQLEWARTALATALQGCACGGDDARSDLAPFWENLAWAYSLAGHHAEALSAFVGARRAHRYSGDTLRRIRADLNVGRAYRLAGQPRTALGWLRETEGWLMGILKAAPEDGEARRLLAQLRLELAECNLDLGRRAKALALLASARELAQGAARPGEGSPPSPPAGPHTPVLATIDHRLRELAATA